MELLRAMKRFHCQLVLLLTLRLFKARGTIVDAPVPATSITGYVEVNGAAGTVTFTVQLSKQTLHRFRLTTMTNNGSAQTGSDFGNGRWKWFSPPGETVKTITV